MENVLPERGCRQPVNPIREIARQFPPGWQATRFPSHFILYKESKTYRHGIRVFPPGGEAEIPEEHTDAG